jgi:hypothetical protein
MPLLRHEGPKRSVDLGKTSDRASDCASYTSVGGPDGSIFTKMKACFKFGPEATPPMCAVVSTRLGAAGTEQRGSHT